MLKNEDAMAYIMSQIRYICNTYKSKTGGSQSECKCQNHFKEQLESWSDSVALEEFTLHPKAFLGWIIPVSLMSIAAVCLFWMRAWVDSVLFPILGFILVTLALVVFVLEYVFYFRFIDPLFPKKTSVNVFARRKPSGEIKQRIIFGGHADAAYEMTYLMSRNTKNSFYVFIGAVAGMVFVWGINLASLISTLFTGSVMMTGLWTVLGIIALLFVPFFMASMFFINWNKVVDGANDNLSASLVSMSVLREMENSGIRLKSTEVCCLITGAEEEGLRGSMAFAKLHKKEFSDVETIFIALETLRETSQLQVYLKGINGTQKNSRYVAELLREAGNNCGVQLGEAGTYPGATDAEAFSREGLLACGLGGINHLPQTYYHTRYDTADNMDENCMQLSLDICMEATRIYDERVQPTSGVLGSSGNRFSGNTLCSDRMRYIYP